MKKYIFVLNAIELLGRLMNGKRVEGVLYMDQNTGKLTFKAYNRQPRIRHKDQLVKKLPWGWVKESIERIKVFGSFPKEYSTAQVMGLLEEHTKDAKNALIERELDIIENELVLIQYDIQDLLRGQAQVCPPRKEP